MLESIIDSCKYVSLNSSFVKINENKLNEFVDSIEDVNVSHWLSSSPFGIFDLPVEMVVNFLLVFESIDFSFWGNPKWETLIDDKKEDGSIALFYVLLKYVKDNNTTDFSGISKDKFKEILNSEITIPLFDERYEIIKNVSDIVNKKMNGNFYNYIKSITDDKKLFNIIIDNFSCFQDERIYKGRSIYFYKLANLLTSDILHVREQLEGIDVCYDHLVGCADYKIPQVMRSFGILQYDEELEKIVDYKKEIPTNSLYEIEIRANMLVALNKIKNKLNNKFCTMDLNDYIFMKSKDKSLVLKPYHLTRNTNY